ncbi:putative mitochondrial glycoprotein-like protein [Trypanosoma grayi]|uniref:putative mitochondrial glycoprotein-like protein n=1 Tax=Trypanosoma grayi TaxID=71804 RepID=UPI0004F462E8|nr:putative mitochondrial glycoprotein-like protein [Trypanosoma grayi]KEG06043.1 putative mitochondrial glycoprotein-like protein [Trypanosoma grayi]
MYHAPGTSVFYGRRLWLPPTPVAHQQQQHQALSPVMERHTIRVQLTTRDPSLDPECDVRGEHFPFSFFAQRVVDGAIAGGGSGVTSSPRNGVDGAGEEVEERGLYEQSVEVRADFVDGELVIDNVVFHGTFKLQPPSPPPPPPTASWSLTTWCFTAPSSCSRRHRHHHHQQQQQRKVRVAAATTVHQKPRVTLMLLLFPRVKCGTTTSLAAIRGRTLTRRRRRCSTASRRGSRSAASTTSSASSWGSTRCGWSRWSTSGGCGSCGTLWPREGSSRGQRETRRAIWGEGEALMQTAWHGAVATLSLSVRVWVTSWIAGMSNVAIYATHKTISTWSLGCAAKGGGGRYTTRLFPSSKLSLSLSPTPSLFACVG